MTLNNMSDDTPDSYMDRDVISKPAVLTPVCPAQLIFKNMDQESRAIRRTKQKRCFKRFAKLQHEQQSG